MSDNKVVDVSPYVERRINEQIKAAEDSYYHKAMMYVMALVVVLLLYISWRVTSIASDVDHLNNYILLYKQDHAGLRVDQDKLRDQLTIIREEQLKRTFPVYQGLPTNK